MIANVIKIDEKLEDRLYEDIKLALANIEHNEIDALKQWQIVGDRLCKLREQNPGYRDGAFAKAVRAKGINLTQIKISQAQWWARITDEERREIVAKHPKARDIHTVYQHRNTLPAGQSKNTQKKSKSKRLDPSTLGAKQQKQIEKFEKHLESEFERRVQDEVIKRINNDVMPFYKEKLEKADQLSSFGKPFTRSEYRLIAAALHPDNTSEERRKEAWALFTGKEVVLRPEEKDRPFTSDLPATVEDLMARRKVRQP